MLQRFFSSRHIARSENIFAVDIGTTAVVGALCERTQTEAYMIKSLKESYDIFSLSRGAFSAVESASVLLRRGLRTLFTNAAKEQFSVDRLFIALSNPFYEIFESEKKVMRAKPETPISDDEIKNLIKIENKKEYLRADKKTASQDLVSLSEYIVSMRVNGYPLHDATGFRGNDLSVRFRTLAASTEFVKIIHEMHDHYFPKATIFCYADAAIVSVALFRENIIASPALVIHIGDEFTDIYIARAANDVRAVHIIPLGVKTFARRIQSVFKISSTEAASLFFQYHAGTLEDASKKRFLAVLNASLEDLKHYFVVAISELFHTLNISIITMYGEGAQYDFFQSAIQEVFRATPPVSRRSISPFKISGHTLNPAGALNTSEHGALISLIFFGGYDM